MQILKRDNKYLGAMQCGGGRDAFVEVLPTQEKVENVKVYCVGKMSCRHKRKVDPNEILKAAEECNQKIEKLFDKPFYIKEVGYIEYDSQHYDLHGGLMYTILKKLSNNESIRETENGNN